MTDVPSTPKDAAATDTDAGADGDAALLGLIDRLTALLERSDLSELEMDAGGTGLTLRKPSALAVVPTVAAAGVASAGASPHGANLSTDGPLTAEQGGDGGAVGRTGGSEPTPAARPSIKAPLTGIFWASPAPGSAPYVTAGGEVAVGQIIGLIEAMKLFNEIKSDLAGRVVRVVPESGTLVKAKQPLIEVEPL